MRPLDSAAVRHMAPQRGAVHLLLRQRPQAWLADDQVIDLPPPVGALLCLLAIEGPQPRSRLGGLLWPQADANTARNRLRQRLFQLRKQCGHTVIDGQNHLALAADVSHDLDQSFTLLGTLEMAELPELDRWLQGERSRRRAQQRSQLGQRIDALEAAGDSSAAVAETQTLLALDPLSEESHRRLIRLHYLRGDRAAALLAFDHCAEVLKHEVGTAPSAQTMQLLQTLQGASTSEPAAARRYEVPASVIRPPRMIGRDALRQRVLHLLDSGAVALVVGEAGMGKSRLLAEVAGEFGRVVCAGARPGDSGVPFASLARLLRELLRQCPDSLAAPQRDELARILPELGAAPAVPGDGARLALERALRQWLAAAAAEIGALAFDDLHFADDASLEMLQTLAAAAGATPLRWLLAMRPAEAGSGTQTLLDTLAEAGRLALAPLQPLSPTEMAELVDTLALPELQGAALGALLHQRSGGNPLFALETLKHLLLDGAGTAPQAALAQARPASVLALIERRLARLAPLPLSVARVAAITGIDFSIEIAEAVLEQPALMLADAWNELQQAQVLRDSAFAHDLVFEAVLQSIPAPIARSTHARVAAYLGDHGAEPARVAEHWQRAERPRDALPWLKAAAQRAGEALRTKEQVDFLVLVADIEEQSGSREAAFEALHAATEAVGKSNFTLAPELHSRLTALASSPLEHAHAAYQWLNHLNSLGRQDDALHAARVALDLARAAGDETLEIKNQSLLGVLLSYAGRNDEALALLLPIRPRVESRVDTSEAMHYFSSVAALLDNSGRPSQSVEFHERAIELARVRREWNNLACAVNNLAVNRMRVGDFVSAESHIRQAEQALSMFENSETGMPLEPINLSYCLRVTGQYSEALRWADEGSRRAQPFGDRVGLAAVRQRLAVVWVDLAQFARAEPALAELASAEDLPLSIRVGALHCRARLQRWRGDLTEVTVEQALNLLPPQARPDLRQEVVLERALLVTPMNAMALIEGVIEEARTHGHEGTVMAAWACRAGRLWPHDPALAAAAAHQALDLAQTRDTAALYRPELWLFCAQALQAAGQADQARAVRAQARAWIMNCVQSGQVPEAFVDSFLHRNPVNRELLSRTD